MAGAETLAASSSLRSRTLTAFLLGPLVIAAILWLPTLAFGLFFGLVVLMAAWEWCGLAGLDSGPARVAYLVVLAVAMLLLWLYPQWHLPLFALSVIWWLAQASHILRLTQIEPVTGLQLALLPVGLLVLALPWAALVHLHGVGDAGSLFVLVLMGLMWTADSLAYFTGRLFGRTKLAPAVSPGKTREGVYGALVGAVLCGLLFARLQSFGAGDTLLVLLVFALSALISVVGDLYESLLKRRRGLKDSGQLLPGHGGLLDRIDSLTSAAPLFTLGLILALH